MFLIVLLQSSNKVSSSFLVGIHTICLIGGSTLNCVLAFSTSKYLFLFFFTLHDDLAFSFSIVLIPTIDIRAYQLVTIIVIRERSI